ncbi:unnamed protein product [Linum trigynum]|uniref:Cystatin domain-containing protein n=1 Tax=Linum trigynum TaxID=586398 RepID=A0AAV2EIZ6_9ROSI
MKPATTFLVAITTIAIVLSTASASSLGGWQRIKNTNDYRVWEVAEFAVGIYNVKNHFKHPLRLVSIGSAEVQVVDGLNYLLIVMATAIDSLNSPIVMYRTEVHERLGVKELKFFTPIFDGLN